MTEKRQLCTHKFEELDESFFLCGICGLLRNKRRLRKNTRTDMPTNKGAQATFDWDRFRSEHESSIPEGLHRTNFTAESARFRSALSLMEEGKSAEQAMATLRVSTGTPISHAPPQRKQRSTYSRPSLTRSTR